MTLAAWSCLSPSRISVACVDLRTWLTILLAFARSLEICPSALGHPLQMK